MHVYDYVQRKLKTFLITGKKGKGKNKKGGSKGKGVIRGVLKGRVSKSVQLNLFSKHQNGKMTRKKLKRSRKRYL